MLDSASPASRERSAGYRFVCAWALQSTPLRGAPGQHGRAVTVAAGVIGAISLRAGLPGHPAPRRPLVSMDVP